MGKLLAAVALLVVVSGTSLGGEMDELAKEIGKDLRSAERAMMGGKKEDAAGMCLAIEAKLAKLEEGDSRHRQLRSLQSKAGKLRRDLEKRLGRSLDPDAAPKMPFELESGLGAVNRGLADAEKGLAANDASQARMGLGFAERNWSNLENRCADELTKDWLEVDATRKRLADVKARIEKLEAGEAGAAAAAEVSEARKEAQSEEWLKRFEPFFPGVSPHKRFENASSYPADQLEKLKANWEEAKTLLDEFDKTEFPDGKTLSLESQAKRLRELVEEFPRECKEALAGTVEAKAREFKMEVERIRSPSMQKWREDEKERPPVVSEKDMARYKAKIDEAAEAIGDDDELIVEIRKLYDDFAKENAEREQIAAKRTFMLADRWETDERETIEKKIRSIVAEEFPKTKILKLCIPRTEWSFSKEIDPQLPASHPRKVKQIQAVLCQAAIRLKGAVYLLGVWVGKEAYGGDYGPLHGNTTYRHRMLEENLKDD